MSLTPEQETIRRTGIGGSESAAIVGLHSFNKPIEVWRGKLEPDYQRPPSIRLEVGELLEPALLELLRRHHKLDVVPGEITYKHPTLPLVASPDGFAGPGDAPFFPYLVEAKTASKWAMADWGPDGSDVVPKQYVVQCLHNMFVLRACGIPMEEALVPVLVDLSEFRVYRVPYAEDIAQAVVRAEVEWWKKYVEGRIPPPPDGTDSYQAYLQRAFPFRRGAEVVAPEECKTWAIQFEEARSQEKCAAKAKALAQQHLKTAMGEAECMLGDGWRATWRPDKSGTRTFRFATKGDE